MSEQTGLFTRLVQTHKPDCILSLDGPAPAAVPAPQELAATLGSEQVAAYAAQCRPIYEDLRRVIGQIAGLSILARLTTQSAIRDLPELAACEARLKDASERLAALASPQATRAHRAQLEAALGFSRAALKTFSGIRDRTSLEDALDSVGLRIKRAYAHLQAASSEKAGLEMVDFSNACCCCAR